MEIGQLEIERGAEWVVYDLSMSNSSAASLSVVRRSQVQVINIIVEVRS